MFAIENYTLISTPRKDRRSGGSALYIHDSVSFRVRDDLNLISNRGDMDGFDHSKSIFIEILNPTHKMLLLVIFIVLIVLILTCSPMTWKIALRKYPMKTSNVIFLVTSI